MAARVFMNVLVGYDSDVLLQMQLEWAESRRSLRRTSINGVTQYETARDSDEYPDRNYQASPALTDPTVNDRRNGADDTKNHRAEDQYDNDQSRSC